MPPAAPATADNVRPDRAEVEVDERRTEKGPTPQDNTGIHLTNRKAKADTGT